MHLLDGNATAAAVLAELKIEVASQSGPRPCVAFIRVGEDPASVSYVSKKQRTAADLGIESRLHVLPADTAPADVIALVDQLNADRSVHGILVQSPLPAGHDETAVFNRVDPAKDVDGFSRVNLGRLVQEDPEAFVACTPAGLGELLRRADINTSGAHVVVVGRSLIVGKPAALLFLRKGLGGDATVTVCHSRTRNLAAITRQADIVVAAIGRPHFLGTDHIREGAVVLDVGINRIADPTRKSGHRLVGDVDFDAVAPRCRAITPVPGGVGPLTVAMLMRNTVTAWQRALG